MEPLERLLAQMDSGQGAPGAAERDLEFRVDPGKVRQTLATLVKADPRLWLKHLLQLLYEVPLEGPVSLAPVGSDLFRLSFIPLDPELYGLLTPAGVYARQGSLLGQRGDSVMARILCEVEAPVLYRHALDGGTALVCSSVGFRLERVSQPPPERGIQLEISIRSLYRHRLFSSKSRDILDALQPLASLHPHIPELHTWQPLVPDWPFPAPTGEDDDRPQLWDWESVLPALVDGFLWDVSALAEPLLSMDDRDAVVVRHPMELKRAFSTLPILGCYPGVVASLMSTRPRYGDRERIRANRVFGVSWTASNPKRAELYPIIRGVPGEAIVLEGAPPGLYLLADASHLRTDASGVRLVRDEAMEAWLVSLVEWAKEQTELYLPFMARIPRFWMDRVKRWDDLDRQPGTWKKMWQTAATALFAAAPVQGLLDRRATELSNWSRRKD